MSIYRTSQNIRACHRTSYLPPESSPRRPPSRHNDKYSPESIQRLLSSATALSVDGRLPLSSADQRTSIASRHSDGPRLLDPPDPTTRTLVLGRHPAVRPLELLLHDLSQATNDEQHFQLRLRPNRVQAQLARCKVDHISLQRSRACKRSCDTRYLKPPLRSSGEINGTAIRDLLDAHTPAC